MTLLENREVGHGDAHLVRKLGERHFPLNHHKVKIDFDRHLVHSNRELFIFFHYETFLKDPGYYEKREAKEGSPHWIPHQIIK
jgi:hypothetical protein